MTDYSIYNKQTVFFTATEIEIMIRSLEVVHDSGGTSAWAQEKIRDIILKLQGMSADEEAKKEYLQ